MTTTISFNKESVPVHLIGADSNLIPSLLSALRNNKLTLTMIQQSLVRIDLFRSEAFLYSSQGDKYRVPIFS